MVAIDQKLSNKLLNVSFVCTLLVVFIHCQSNGQGALFHFLRGYVPGAFLAMAVPTFFAISGFLLAGGCGKPGWYKTALTKRVKTLLVPYVILNCLYFPIFWAVHAVAVSRFGADGSASVMTLSWRTPFEILGFPFFGEPAIGPLWYIATLMYFVVFSPLLFCVLRKSRLHACLAVLTTIVIFAAWHSIKSTFAMPAGLGHFLYFGFSLWGLIFFTMGMAVRMWLSALPMGVWAKVGGLVGVIAALVLARYGKCDDNVLYIAPAILCMMGLMAVMPSVTWPRYLTANAFALYALHVPFLYLFNAMLKVFHLHYITSWGYGLILEWVVCVVATIAIVQLVRKMFPMAVRICFGGR